MLLGNNGQGKTSVLEAIYLASTSRILRGLKDSDVISEGKSTSWVEVHEASTGADLRVELGSGQKKRVYINGSMLPRASDLLGRLPCVCISSIDLPIVSGEPACRRTFLDTELSQAYPAYLRHLAIFKRAMEQRNALLRDSKEFARPADLFEPWESEIALHGAAIRQYRMGWIREVGDYAVRIHAELGDGEKVGVSYEIRSDENILGQLQERRSEDIARGSTSAGPHRDDLIILVDGKSARIYASQGQQRSAMISIKLAVFNMLRTYRGSQPILLLDDVFSELDQERGRRLIKMVLRDEGQIIVTCTDTSVLGPILDLSQRDRPLDYALFRVEAGTVSRT